REQLRTIGPLTSASLVSHIETKANIIAGTNGPMAVGALLEVGIHLLDLVRYLTGEEIVSVQCTMTPASDAGPETQVHAQLHTAGGIRCALDVARVEAQRRGMAEWRGTEGTIKADWVARTLTRAANDGASRTWTLEPHPTILAALQAFIHAVRTGTTPP